MAADGEGLDQLRDKQPKVVGVVGVRQVPERFSFVAEQAGCRADRG